MESIERYKKLLTELIARKGTADIISERCTYRLVRADGSPVRPEEFEDSKLPIYLLSIFNDGSARYLWLGSAKNCEKILSLTPVQAVFHLLNVADVDPKRVLRALEEGDKTTGLNTTIVTVSPSLEVILYKSSKIIVFRQDYYPAVHLPLAEFDAAINDQEY